MAAPYNDPLRIYRGEDYVINDWITIHQPSLGEICDFGEQDYWQAVYGITATPTDMKYQLHQIGVDWNDMEDWEGFRIVYRAYTPDVTSLLLGDLDLSEYEEMINKQNDEIVLYNRRTGSTIDRSIYQVIVDYLRTAHSLKRNVQRAMTTTTKMVLLEEAEEEYRKFRDKPFESTLLPLISTMCCMPGFKYNQNDIWDMKINAFMKAIKTVMHIKNADLLLQSGYSGFGVDLKSINKKHLDYFGG